MSDPDVCDECGDPIFGEVAVARGGTLHPECHDSEARSFGETEFKTFGTIYANAKRARGEGGWSR